jgi:hypothetical protein
MSVKAPMKWWKTLCALRIPLIKVWAVVLLKIFSGRSMMTGFTSN